MGENGADKPLIFISYSHKDETHLGHILEHLGVLSELGTLTPWHDDKIGVGETWYSEIEKSLNNCAVAILLISPGFLGSKFCMQKEVPTLLERRRRDGMLIVPILVESCFWKPIKWLNAIQMRPGKGNVMEALNKAQRNRAYSAIIEEIFDFLESDAAKIAATRPPPAQGQATSISGENSTTIQIEGDNNTIALASKPKTDSAWPPLSSNAVDIDRLPRTGYDLLGREDELELLDEAWESDTTNIVSLVAWGGVGKSTLLNKWVEYLAADNYRGARRVFAWSFYSQGTNERVTSADAFVDEALRFFGDAEPGAGSPWSRGERLADLVGQEKVLLLLDGMEPLQDEYQGIKDPALSRLIECLADRNDGLCVITTREPVKEFADFPETTLQKNLEFLSPEAGRALLRVKGIRGSDAELEAASAAFGNHALAINLLASFLRDCAGRHIQHAQEIPDLTDFDDPNHHHPRRVMAAFAEHFGDGPELDLLHMIGLFNRPADEGCIKALRAEPAVPGLTESLSELNDLDWHKLLEKLRDLGLLAPASHITPDELDAHPLVREQFGMRLRDRRAGSWRAGHLRLYKHLQTVPDDHQPDTLAEMAPLFQAAHHGCAAGRHQEVYDKIYRARIRRENEAYLVGKLGAFGADLGMVASFFDPPWEKPEASLAEGNQAWLLNAAAFRLRALGQLRDAVAPMRAGLERYIEQESWAHAARTAGSLSELYLTLGDIEEAAKWGKASIDHADRSGDDFVRMADRTILADALIQRGDLQAAKALFKEAEALQAKRQPTYPKLFSLGGSYYCDLLLTLGHAEEVRKHTRQILKWTKMRGGSLLDIAIYHLSLGRAALALGEQAEAGTQLDQAVDGLRKAGRFDHTPRGLLARTALFREMDKLDNARKDLDEALRIAKRGEMRLYQCDAHLEYARLAVAEGKPDAARAHLKSAAALVSACGYHRRDEEIAALEAALA